MNDEDLALFKRMAIRSKKELVRAIEDYLAGTAEADLSAEDQVAENFDLMRAFKAKIEKSPIPFLEKQFCAYEVVITDVEISLEMAEYKDIVFNCDGEMEEATASVTSDIVCIRAPYITADEFAKRRNVTLATVKRWLREGKLHNAEKRDSGWYVAATQRKPSRGMTDGTFIFESADGDLSCFVPVPEGTVFVSFFENESSSTAYTALYQNENQRVLARPDIEQEELERIKKALIGMPDVIFQSTFTDAIIDKVIFEYCGLKNTPLILPKIEEFIDSSTLPLETKRLLKMMLLSEADGELFLSTIRKLGLEESLRCCLQ